MEFPNFLLFKPCLVTQSAPELYDVPKLDRNVEDQVLRVPPPGRAVVLQVEVVLAGHYLLLLRHVAVEHQGREGSLSREVGDDLSWTEGSSGEESLIRAGYERVLDEDRLPLVRVHDSGVVAHVVREAGGGPVVLQPPHNLTVVPGRPRPHLLQSSLDKKRFLINQFIYSLV